MLTWNKKDKEGFRRHPKKASEKCKKKLRTGAKKAANAVHEMQRFPKPHEEEEDNLPLFCSMCHCLQKKYMGNVSCTSTPTKDLASHFEANCILFICVENTKPELQNQSYKTRFGFVTPTSSTAPTATNDTNHHIWRICYLYVSYI